MSGGWVKIHRSILSWEWWHERNTRDLFFYLVIAANHDDQHWQGNDIPRGSIATSRKKLMEAVDLSEQEVRTALNNLQNSQQITCSTSHKQTIITILNYDKYQMPENDSQPENNQPANQKTTSKTTSKNTDVIICNRDKYNTLENGKQPTKQPANNQPANQQITSSREKEKKNPPITPYKENKKREQEEKKEENILVVENARAREEEVPPSGAVMMDIDILATQLKEEITLGGTVSESAARLYGIGQNDLVRYVDWFNDKLRLDGTKYKTHYDYRTHFSNWLRIQVENQLKQNKNGNNNSNNARISAGYVERKMREAGLL